MNSAKGCFSLRDVQSERDYRKIYLRRVGVRSVSYPVKVLDRRNGSQHTVASVNMFVDLPHDFRGAHMSRFIEVLNEYHLELNPKRMRDILERLRDTLEAERASMEVLFPYFILKRAPVSGIESYLRYDCSYTAELSEGSLRTFTSVTVPIVTLCPCSKEISERGAHNQRAFCRVTFESDDMVWIEDVIELVERSGSAPVFTLLKRVDEKYITEYAYDHPMFVEDVARDVALGLKGFRKVKWFRVEVESLESIHLHNAYACVVSDDFSV